MTRLAPFLRRTGAMAALTGLLILTADWLFYDRPVGWTIGGFAAILALIVTLSRPASLRRRSTRIVLAAIAGLVIALVIEPSPHAIALMWTGLVTLAILSRKPKAAADRWLERCIEFSARVVVQPVRDILLWIRASGRSGYRSVRAIALMNRWWLAAALGCTFAALLSAGNPLIERAVDDAWTALLDAASSFEEFIAPDRLALWAAVAISVWGLLRAKVRRKANESSARSQGRWAAIDRGTGVHVVVNCLALFNALFAVQTVLDVIYLWGGASLPAGVTFAEYAHRGAYPLVFTALLAGLFVLITFRAGGPSERSRLARALVYLWIGQNVLLLLSAVWRLELYVEAYSLTRWRLAAGVWMIAVILGFGCVLIRLLRERSNRWLLQACSLTAVGMVYLCSFIDGDGVIASFNVARCREVSGSGPPLDLEYLQSLGHESLAPLASIPAESLPLRVADELHRVRHLLRRDLKHSLSDWRGWTWRRSIALAAAPERSTATPGGSALALTAGRRQPARVPSTLRVRHAPATSDATVLP